MQSKDEGTKTFKSIMYTMFGFIITQPIHQTLRQMRLIHVLILLNSQWLLWAIVDRIERLDPVQAAIAYGVIAGALITAIWQGIKGLHTRTEKDPD